MALVLWKVLLILTIKFSISKSNKPNVILILTDDQDIVLKGMNPMKATQNLVGLKGVTFTNAFTSSPICCPSRSSILCGQYAHNHATINNSVAGGCYGDFWRENVEQKTIPVKLESVGYETFFAGKYLNEYTGSKVPPGWQNFFGLHGNSRYYNYTLTENGKLVNYSDQYLTDVINNHTMNFLKTRAVHKPFFAMIAPPAPHAPYTPAVRHENAFPDVKILKPPNFNLKSGILDKHWLLTMMPEFDDTIIEKLDIYYRKRWQSLLAVDELVENIVVYLESTGLMNNTYIIYTSDNGYHLGQFAQPTDKRQPYETDIRVPLIVRGPGIQPKSISEAPVLLIDIYATILEWVGMDSDNTVDGESFAHHACLSEIPNSLEDTISYNRQILIEYWGEGTKQTYNPKCPWSESSNLSNCDENVGCRCQDARNNTYACIRDFSYKRDMIYCEFSDSENFVEAYDLHMDPYQITNLGYQLLPIERALYSIKLSHLKECIGQTCRT